LGPLERANLNHSPFSGEGETPTLLGPLERANLNHFPSSSEGRETKSRNPVILSVTDHRQNPLESNNKIRSSNFGVLVVMNLYNIYEVLFVLNLKFPFRKLRYKG
jgi:hypothetical protein